MKTKSVKGTGKSASALDREGNENTRGRFFCVDKTIKNEGVSGGRLETTEKVGVKGRASDGSCQCYTNTMSETSKNAAIIGVFGISCCRKEVLFLKIFGVM